MHRDLKPENLFLESGATVPFVKILDFGISKFDPERTGASAHDGRRRRDGHALYMAPEQARGEKRLDAQADVYALGVVLYECLCGAKPFVAETLPHLAILIAEGRYEPASMRRPGLEAQCDAIIGRAMVADRSVRYKSAEELKAALETLRRRAPGEQPQTLPFAGTIPVELMANAVPRGADTGAPALTGSEQGITGAPLSHTKPESAARGRGGVVWAVLGLVALAGVALALVLARGSRPGHETTGETLAGDGRHATNATAKAAGAPVVEPTLLPTATASLAPPPSAPSARAPSPAPKAEKPHGKTRAAEHGLSEQNPF